MLDLLYYWIYLYIVIYNVINKYYIYKTQTYYQGKGQSPEKANWKLITSLGAAIDTQSERDRGNFE